MDFSSFSEPTYIGLSNNNSDDTHPTFWIPYDDVYETVLSLKRKK